MRGAARARLAPATMRSWMSSCRERVPAPGDVEREENEHEREPEADGGADDRARSLDDLRRSRGAFFRMSRARKRETASESLMRGERRGSANAPSTRSTVGNSTASSRDSGSSASGDCAAKPRSRLLRGAPKRLRASLDGAERRNAEPDAGAADLGDRPSERRNIVRCRLEVAHEKYRPGDDLVALEHRLREIQCDRDPRARAERLRPRVLHRAEARRHEQSEERPELLCRRTRAEGARTARPRRRRDRSRPPRPQAP